jgi:hypothetical protein
MIRLNSRRNRQIGVTALAGIAVLCAGTSALAGRGGSSSPTVSGQPARQTVAPSSADVGNAQTQAGHDSQAQRISGTTHARASGATHARASGATHARASGATHARASGATHAQSSVRTAVQTVRAAGQAPATTAGEPTGGGAPQLNPCTLVTASEAGGMTGGPIAGLVEAPQGPTCIYKSGNSKPQITLTVEPMSFSAVTHQLTNTAPFTMGTHSAVCGQLGTQMLFLSLAGGQVLNVTAPCSIAKQFASKALTRLGG